MKGESFDVELISNTGGTIEAVNDAAELRRRLSSAIRDIKFGPAGGAAWQVISKLATIPSEDRLNPDDSNFRLMPYVKAALDKLQSFQNEFWDWREWSDYRPGRDELLDSMIRMDIHRLDVTLTEAPPWSGDEPHMSEELAALMHLVADERLATVLKTVCETSP